MTTTAIVWLLIGAAFLGLNKVIKQYNFIYAAAAAFTIAVFIFLGIMGGDAPEYYEYHLIAQVIFFFIATTLWWYLFHEKKEKQTDADKEFYQQLVGKTVEVCEGGINSISGGEIISQGRKISAKLAADSNTTSFDAGDKVQVKLVNGSIAIVTNTK